MKVKFRKKNLFYSFIALLFTLVLFFNANSSSLQKNIIPTSTTYEENVKDVTIQPIYDSDEYFIQGFNTTVAVKLTSDNRVQLNTEKNQETRNFRVVADLSKLTVGTHEVALKVQNLSSGVTATLASKSITVTIEKKVTKTTKVSASISEDHLQDGYQLGKITVEPSEVEITTGEDTLKELTSVEASLSHLTDLNKDTSTKASVVAVDKNGEKLPAVISPEQVTVNIEVNAPTKEVPVNVVPSGTMDSSVSDLTYRLDQDTVTVTGAQALLDQIDRVSLPVDIVNISKITQVEVAVPVEDGVTADPASIWVTIVPTLKQTTESTSSSSASQSSETTDKTSTSSSSQSSSTSSEESTNSSESSESTSSDN